jgi:hypothetical protein
MKFILKPFAAAALILTMTTAHASVFFVAPNGADTNPGTLAKPFATIGRAQIAARHARAHGPVTVAIRAGTYFLTAPIVFTSADSGSPSDPVVYQGYQDERPVISGALPLRLTWTPYKNGIFQADLHATGAAVPNIDQLFVDGRLQRMARYPNYDPSAKYYHGTAPDATSPERVKTWIDPNGGYVHGLHQNMWGSMDYEIAGKDADGNLTLEGGWQTNRPASISDKYRFVENIFEELDAPGEWYLNRSTGILYFMPPAGVDIGNASVCGSVLQSLVEIRGDAAHPVRDIKLEGLVFTQTSRTFMLTKEPLLRSDWRIYRGGAAFVSGADNCAITDCDFVDIGGNAVFVSGYNRHVDIADCKIAGVGASGICFVGLPSAVRSPLFEYDQSQPESAIDPRPGPLTDDYPAECAARDVLITNIGEIEKQAAGVEIDMARDITVSHCSIYDVPRAGINIGDGCWGGHVIEYCDVFDTVKESGDHGSFNSWGRDRYWMPDRDAMNKVVADHPDWFKLDAVKPIVMRNNCWVCRHGWDIDLDDGSSNYIIENNLCLGGGIKNREGAYRDVENNILVDSTFHPHVWFVNSHDIFMHNIVMTPYEPILMPVVWGSEIDENLLPDSKALSDQQSAGRDPRSLAGDPRFVDPSVGDFRVRPGSPALAIGFVNFPMDRFGVTSKRLRDQAANGFDFAVATSQGFSAPQSAATHTWLGATVKSVTTPGEQSAAGLPQARGVLILAVPSDSDASRYGLKVRDVIWTADSAPLRDYEDLIKAAGARELGVYRNQSIVTIDLSRGRELN